MKRSSVILICFLLLLSCKKEINKQDSLKKETTSDSFSKPNETEAPKNEFVRQSIDPQTANNIKNFLVDDYLKDELEFLQPNDRKFQFYKTDLNADGHEEIFVRFMSAYFCGTGGCTFLLLDKSGKIITKFSVTRAPIFIEPTKENGWALLLVKDSGVFKELKYSDGKYPSNPSVLPKAPYDAPSGHAEVIFHDAFYKSKTFTF